MAKKKGGKTTKKKENISFVNVDSSLTGGVKDDYEVFDIEKDGKEKNIIQPLKESEKPASKEQIKKENKILKKAVIVMMGAVLLFFIFYAVMYFSRVIEYKGVKFELDKATLVGKTLYRTSVPVIFNGTEATYSFWLRNDPRVLEKIVPVDGDIVFRNNIVLNVTTENLFCDGDWNLALGNLIKLNIFGINVLAWNKSANYTPEEAYMFVSINEGNKTEIKEDNGFKILIGGQEVNRGLKNNYKMNIANCEVLPAAERFLLEAFVKYNKIAEANK